MGRFMLANLALHGVTITVIITVLLLGSNPIGKLVPGANAESHIITPERKTVSTEFVHDPYSRSNPAEAVTTKFHWKASVNFEAKTIDAIVYYEVRRQPGVMNIILDAGSDLRVNSVSDASGNSLEFERLPKNKRGAPLNITLPKDASNVTVVINYSTSPAAEGVQWLEPVQTREQRWPFVYSTNMANSTRTIIPCQDTPQVKMTFSAEVHVPKGYEVLMGALRILPRHPSSNKTTDDSLDEEASVSSERVFKFRQDMPVPTCLIAIAVGHLTSRRVGRITELWAEEGYLTTGAHDFSDIDKMLDAAESIVGPYRFGEHNILILPPSYPERGMGLPCLTFVSPTFLTGNQSIVPDFARELALSWFGSVVTPKTHELIRFSAGFVQFLERKIRGALFGGEDERKLLAMMGTTNLYWTPLRISAERFHATGLNIENEKAHAFLWYLEELVGGSRQMNAFLRAYVDEFAFKTVDFEQMKASFISFFRNDTNISTIDWDMWLNHNGPMYLPDYNSSYYMQVEELMKKWRNIHCNVSEPVSSTDIEHFTPTQKIAFLWKVNLETVRLSQDYLRKMATDYSFDATHDNELLVQWLAAALRNHYEPAIEPAKNLLRRFGRIKYEEILISEFVRWRERSHEIEELFDEIAPRLTEASRGFFAEWMQYGIFRKWRPSVVCPSRPSK